METQAVETRVRTNVSLTAKGVVQWDITSEFPTEEDSVKNLSKALDDVRTMIKEKGLKEAGE